MEFLYRIKNTNDGSTFRPYNGSAKGFYDHSELIQRATDTHNRRDAKAGKEPHYTVATYQVTEVVESE